MDDQTLFKMPPFTGRNILILTPLPIPKALPDVRAAASGRRTTPPREPGHYVAIAFEVCGFMRNRVALEMPRNGGVSFVPPCRARLEHDRGVVIADQPVHQLRIVHVAARHIDAVRLRPRQRSGGTQRPAETARCASGGEPLPRFQEWSTNLLGACADRANIGMEGAVYAKQKHGTTFGTRLRSSAGRTNGRKSLSCTP
jgi:hypothetical protein